MNDAPTLPHATVLLIDDDSFERDYVQDVLAARGIGILGPFADPHLAFAAIAATPPDAAVMAWSGDPAEGRRLSDELLRRAIPCLTLAHDPTRPPADDIARLVRPFAAFQVAEWVSATLATRRSAAD